MKKIRLIIAGSRSLSFEHVRDELGFIENIVSFFYADFKMITEIVSGACGIKASDPNREEKYAKGADYLGEIFADNFNIPIKRFYANWDAYGGAAGMVRNKEMQKYADEALVIHTNTPGSRNMIQLMRDSKKPFNSLTFKTNGIKK